MIANDKLLSYPDRILSHKPITADIFLTNYCNNNCHYCTYKRWELSHGARYMIFEDFQKYVEIMRGYGVEGFILTGGGEPTINPDFERITDYLERNAIHYGINTNFNIFKYLQPDYMKVSLDGWDEESYEQSRGVRAYELVRGNIKKYIKIRDERGDKTRVGIQRVCKNRGDVRKFYEANADLPVDFISFRPVESTDCGYYKLIGEKERAAEILEDLEEMKRSDNRVAISPKWRQIDMRFDSCVCNWGQLAIDEAGNVMYCCHMPYDVVGHITDPDILERKARHCVDMSKCDVPCRMSGPNEMLLKITMPREDGCFL